MPGGARRGGSRGAADEEQQEELAELAQRLERAQLPPEARKVAMRELKRLEKSSEQQPGERVPPPPPPPRAPPSLRPFGGRSRV